MQCSLTEACSYICNIQRVVLSSGDLSKVLINELEFKKFYAYWQIYVKNCLSFIENLINYYSKQLNDILAKIVDTKVDDDVNNILAACNQYEEYIKLIFQIKLEIDYMETGMISCLGHKNEMVLIGTKMNRSIDLKTVYDTNINMKTYSC